MKENLIKCTVKTEHGLIVKCELSLKTIKELKIKTDLIVKCSLSRKTIRAINIEKIMYKLAMFN